MITAALAASCEASGHGGRAAMSEWGPFTEGVTLSLEAPAPAFPPGAEIVLAARLMNYSNAPIRAPVSSVWLDYEIHVTRDGEGEIHPTALAAQRREAAYMGRHTRQDLQNKEKFTEEIPLSEWFDLSRPGRYRVVASRGFRQLEPEPPRDLTVRSNELVLEIR
jgi:hypothetical protein